MNGKDPASGTQSLDRAVDVLRIVASRSGRGIRLVHVVERSGLAKPTAHRLLQALERQGLVAQEPGDKFYHLGPEAFVIGTLAAERFSIHRLALPSLTRLAAASEDTCFISVQRDTHVVCLHREEGPFPIRSHVLLPGDRHPLGVGAGSLAILAVLPDAEAEAAIAANAPQLGDHYPAFSPAFLREEIIRTRQRGYALNEGKLQAGSWGLGVAVLNRRGRCEGALSIAAIESRLASPRREQMAVLLKAEGQRLSDRLARPTGSTDFGAAPKRQSSANLNQPE